MNGAQVVVGHDQSVQCREHGAKFSNFIPLMEIVICDVEQTQCGAGHGSRCHSGVLIKAQEQLLKPGQNQSILVESSHTKDTVIKCHGSDDIWDKQSFSLNVK